MKVKSLFAALTLCCFLQIQAQDILIAEQKAPGFFPLVTTAGGTVIYVDAKDHWLMYRAAEWLQKDLEMLTGKKAKIVSRLPLSADFLIVIGSADSSSFVKQLGAEKKIQINSLTGHWEKFQLQNIQNPAKGIRHALIISGSDKRGTAYAVLELSKRMGVSPWYWWADVPVKKKKEIFIKNGLYS